MRARCWFGLVWWKEDWRKMGGAAVPEIDLMGLADGLAVERERM